MDEENVLFPAEKRKADEARLTENENNCTKKLCQDAEEEEGEGINDSKSDVTKSSTLESNIDLSTNIKTPSAVTCTPDDESSLIPVFDTKEKGSNSDSTEDAIVMNADIGVKETVSKEFVENKSSEESNPLSEINSKITIAEGECVSNDIKVNKSENIDCLSDDLKNSEVKSSSSSIAGDDLSEHEKNTEIEIIATSNTFETKEIVSNEPAVTGVNINSEHPVADAKEADCIKTITDSILCSNSVDKTSDTCESTNEIIIESKPCSNIDIGLCVPEKSQKENFIAEDKCTQLLDSTMPSTIVTEDYSISSVENSGKDEVNEINNSVSISNSTVIVPIQDKILESSNVVPNISETSAEKDAMPTANNISVEADTKNMLPTLNEVATVSFISALKDTDAILINDEAISNIKDDQAICETQREDIVNENLQGDLPLSENAQSPSFISSKEISEDEPPVNEVITPSKIPTLAESLKQAVSENSPSNDLFSMQVPISSNEMLEVIKKNEPSPMEVDTPSESFIDTPCESGETTPSMSTPVDSCQVSAAPSPLTKEDSAVIIPDNEDESSKDTKLNEDEIGLLDAKEEVTEEMPPRKRQRKGTSKAAKKMPTRTTKQKGPLVLDEDTRMSATGNDKSCLIEFPPDEDSQSSVSTSLTSSKKKVRSFRSEVIVPESTEVFTADKVVEYVWPMDANGEHYFIQEHVAQYLGVTSFKRKYRDLRRRQIESTEKEYLKDMGLVSEMACDLGLTAVRSEDMLDILFNDFPSKYEELQKFWRERDEKNLLKEKGKVDYQVANLDKSKMQEYSRKAALNASKWNSVFMREKREERRYSFDLQTFTVHYPLKTSKPSPQEPKIGSYPIAVLPGQYTDYCRSYASKELKSMPLQTVLTGPYTAEELATEAFSAESDEESAPASVCTSVDIKEEIPPVVELESAVATLPASIDPLSAEKQPRCKACNGGRDRNKEGKPEPLVICGTCRIASHPTCIDLPLAMIEKIEMYSWQCMECKTCAQCNDPDDEEKMIFCDMCDRGYHIYCVGLRKVPNGRWHCKECAICSSCGSKTPSGNEHIKNAEWQHEFKKDKDKQLKYICTLCVPCDKYWKRRQYCTVCLKVYRSIPDDGMVRCAGCPKYIHKDGCSLLVDNERHCTICFSSRNKTALNHSRIIAAAKKKMASSY